MELLYLLGVIGAFAALKLLYDRFADSSKVNQTTSNFANRLLEIHGEQFVAPSLTPVLEDLAENLTAGDTDPIEQEMAALYFGAATVAIALTDRSVEEQRNLARELARLYGSINAPGTRQSTDEWAQYFQGRAAYYERAAPVGRAPEAEDLQRIGKTFLDGIKTDPRYEEDKASSIECDRKEWIGHYFIKCVERAYTALSETENKNVTELEGLSRKQFS